MMMSRLISRPKNFSQGFLRGVVLANAVAALPAAGLLAWHNSYVLSALMVLSFCLSLVACRRGLA